MAQLQSAQHTDIVHAYKERVYVLSLPVDIGDGDGQVPLAIAERLVAIGLGEYQIVGEIESGNSGGSGSSQNTTAPTDGATALTGAETIALPGETNEPPADDGGDDPEGDDPEGGESEIPTPSTRTRSKRRV